MMTEEQVTEMIRDTGLANIVAAMFRERNVSFRVLYIEGEQQWDIEIGLDQVMRVCAEDAVEVAKDQFQIDLDFSESSIEKLEAILAKRSQTMPKSFFGRLFRRLKDENALQEETRMWGAYLGQVIYKHSDATWGLATDEEGRPCIVLIRAEKVVPITDDVLQLMMYGNRDSLMKIYRDMVYF